MWFIFALLSALFASVRKTNEKQLSSKLNPFTLGFAVQLLSLPIMLVALLVAGKVFNPFSLSARFWIPTLIIWVGFYPLNTYLTVNAMKHGELSKILPLQSLGPVIALLIGAVFLSQIPTLAGLMGIITIVTGIYILNMKGSQLHNPLDMFRYDIANLYTLVSLFLTIGAGALDVVAIKASEPLYYTFVSTVGAVIALCVSSRLFRVRGQFRTIMADIKPLSLAGLMFGGSYAAYSVALSLGPLAYVSALRSSALLMGTIIGVLYLKESLTRNKVLAIAVITVGSLILSLN